MSNKRRFIVIGVDKKPLSVLGYFHSEEGGYIYVTLGKNPTAIPWPTNQLVEVPPDMKDPQIEQIKRQLAKNNRHK